MSDHGRALIEALQDPDCFDHPVTAFELVETHISWLLLTGPVAYKLKKPLRFPFLDFSTLECRRQACEDELRLNRRFAPQIYESVVPVTEGARGEIELGGPGPVLDYLVRMRQFDRRDMLDAMAERSALSRGIVDQLAEVLGEVHARAPRMPEGSPWGSAEEIHGWVRENFESLRPIVDDAEDRACLERLDKWTQAEHARLAPSLDARRDAGLLRECHGDLHLGNIVLLSGRPTPFDCIEFNPALRWLDPFNDLAFLLMDLRERGLDPLAWRVLSAYLQHSGDYAGLAVLTYYLVYRALVRAKVAAFRMTQPDVSEAVSVRSRAELRAHLKLAERFAGEQRRLLILTHGLSGSGKSHLASRLVEHIGAIQIRSDLERKRIHGLRADARSGSGLDGGIYSADATRRSYARVWDCASAALSAGFPVIVDATFLRRAERDRFRALAEEGQVPCVILDIQAPPALLDQRVRTRQAAAEDASEAGPEVLRRQMASQEPLGEDERPYSLVIDSTRWDAAEQAARALLARFPDLARAVATPDALHFEA